LAYKIKAAKKRPGAEMTGTAEVYEKLDEGLAELSELAGEFVNAGLTVAVALAI
jgi:hypothetical protein